MTPHPPALLEQLARFGYARLAAALPAAVRKLTGD